MNLVRIGRRVFNLDLITEAWTFERDGDFGVGYVYRDEEDQVLGSRAEILWEHICSVSTDLTPKQEPKGDQL